VRIVLSTREAERPSIVEGRTITTLAELQEFCAAVVEKAHADPADVRLRTAQGMRVFETTAANGKKVYDLQVFTAG
jgi:hypothetical protein